MHNIFSEDQTRDLISRGFSRRNFGRLAAVLTAGAAVPFYNEAALAQLSRSTAKIDSNTVKIDANENPLGPCTEARTAIANMIPQGGRYVYGETDTFVDTLAEQESLKSSYVRPFAGSSAPLHQSVLGFCGPQKSFVTCDPGYEAGERAAESIGAKVHRVPLMKNDKYKHDVRAMASIQDAGLIYICNPNNPTGTTTPRADIAWLVDNKPKGAVILLDEAYIHIAGEPMLSEFVAKDKDVIILRTFSKIYGMAGIRAGAAMGRPDLLDKVTKWSAGAMPITGMAAATASLKAKSVVPERRRMIAEVRTDLFAWMDKNKFSYVPSVSNKFMVDVKKPGNQVRNAMAEHNILIGRTWPSWPTHVRVTIGTQDEMNKFKAAFLKVMA